LFISDVNQSLCVDSLLGYCLLENLGGRSNELIGEFMKLEGHFQFYGLKSEY